MQFATQRRASQLPYDIKAGVAASCSSITPLCFSNLSSRAVCQQVLDRIGHVARNLTISCSSRSHPPTHHVQWANSRFINTERRSRWTWHTPFSFRRSRPSSLELQPDHPFLPLPTPFHPSDRLTSLISKTTARPAPSSSHRHYTTQVELRQCRHAIEDVSTRPSTRN